MGNFNIQVNWEKQFGAGPQDRGFVECLRDAFLEQLVREPTRDKAILDLVLCNEQGLISDLEAKEPLGGSDHNMICFYLQFEKDKGSSEVSVLQLNRGNYGAMREELAKVDWMDSLAEKTVEQQWQFEKDKGSSEVSVLQLNRGNYGAMREELAKVDWTDILAEKTVEKQWQFEKDKGSSEVSVLQLNKGDYGAMREELVKVHWTDILAEKTVEQQWQHNGTVSQF
ncbi:uncharacterized protein [Hemitrygon akajei]|uniref:uncharacterized protein isoform X2 n=1 Tax=Hemitrygon akajei TaxID=2704970 RepID=UPI003BF9A009